MRRAPGNTTDPGQGKSPAQGSREADWPVVVASVPRSAGEHHRGAGAEVWRDTGLLICTPGNHPTQPSGRSPLTAGKTTTAVKLLNRARLENDRPAYAVIEKCEAGFASTSGAQVVTVDGAEVTPAAIRWAQEDGARVIYVDDLRDSASAAAAVDAALSGVLVFATLHSSACGAAQRLLDMLPAHDDADNPDEVDRVRRDNQAKVDSVLRGVLEQVLVRVEGHGPRALVGEVWAQDDHGRLAPVQPLAAGVAALVADGTVTPDDAALVVTRRY